MSNIRPSEFQELRSETNKILHFLAPERTWNFLCLIDWHVEIFEEG